jgi:hypothetical protein
MIVVVLGDTVVASWPLVGSNRPDLGVADELARLQLAARRLGCSIHLRDAGVDVLALLDLVGLGDVVTDAASLQAGGKAEGGEQLCVEEVVEPDDPVA